jgi:hypothetical protein
MKTKMIIRTEKTIEEFEQRVNVNKGNTKSVSATLRNVFKNLDSKGDISMGQDKVLDITRKLCEEIKKCKFSESELFILKEIINDVLNDTHSIKEQNDIEKKMLVRFIDMMYDVGFYYGNSKIIIIDVDKEIFKKIINTHIDLILSNVTNSEYDSCNLVSDLYLSFEDLKLKYNWLVKENKNVENSKNDNLIKEYDIMDEFYKLLNDGDDLWIRLSEVTARCNDFEGEAILIPFMRHVNNVYVFLTMTKTALLNNFKNNDEYPECVELLYTMINGTDKNDDECFNFSLFEFKDLLKPIKIKEFIDYSKLLGLKPNFIKNFADKQKWITSKDINSKYILNKIIPINKCDLELTSLAQVIIIMELFRNII